MCLCTLCADRFLRSVKGANLFRDYCRDRDIPFAPSPSGAGQKEDVQRWITALSGLPDDRRALVEWEIDAIGDLGGRAGTVHLLGAAADAGPPPLTVPDGHPLALWFLLHRPSLFREVFFHHEHRDPDVWHAAKAPPGLRISDADGTASALSEAFGAQCRGNTGPLLAVEVHRAQDALFVVGRTVGRPQWVEGVDVAGARMQHRLTPAACVQFAYYPSDGTVLLQAPGAPDRLRVLLDRFAQLALGCRVNTGGGAFALDRLKQPFHPLSDAEAIEMVRVRTLRLRYPEREGRRTLLLQVLTSDDPEAMDELLREHVRDDELPDLEVAHAELQVRLRMDGRAKNHLVRLWPDRCDVGRGPVGDRILSCLRRSGL
jgi:hypothetical protein